MEAVVSEVILEILSSVILSFGSYFVYQGIEISHPVYAIIFCDLLASLASSLTNIAIFPFSINGFRYTTIAYGISLFCLLFHCCCWCVISALRYLFIIQNDWMDEKFPESKICLLSSLSALVILVMVNCAAILGAAVYNGYPSVRIIDMPQGPKATCIMVIMINLMLMIFISCWCNFKNLQHRGKARQNTVHVVNENEPTMGQLFFIENSNHGHLEQKIFARIQSETILRKQKAEIRSAILSLNTNLAYVFLIIIVLLVGALCSSDILLVIFSLLKSQAPVVSSVINFAKIRNLMRSSYDELRENLIYFTSLVNCNKNGEGVHS